MPATPRSVHRLGALRIGAMRTLLGYIELNRSPFEAVNGLGFDSRSRLPRLFRISSNLQSLPTLYSILCRTGLRAITVCLLMILV